MAIARMTDGYFQTRVAGINPIESPDYTIVLKTLLAEEKDELRMFMTNNIGDVLQYDPLDPVGGVNPKSWIARSWRFNNSPTEDDHWWRFEIVAILIPGGQA